MLQIFFSTQLPTVKTLNRLATSDDYSDFVIASLRMKNIGESEQLAKLIIINITSLSDF